MNSEIPTIVILEIPEQFSPRLDTTNEISFQDVLNQNLQVMDAQAIHHCMEHNIPIVVFNFGVEGNILRAVQGEKIRTTVEEG